MLLLLHAVLRVAVCPSACAFVRRTLWQNERTYFERILNVLCHYFDTILKDNPSERGSIKLLSETWQFTKQICLVWSNNRLLVIQGFRSLLCSLHDAINSEKKSLASHSPCSTLITCVDRRYMPQCDVTCYQAQSMLYCRPSTFPRHGRLLPSCTGSRFDRITNRCIDA